MKAEIVNIAGIEMNAVDSASLAEYEREMKDAIQQMIDDYVRSRRRVHDDGCAHDWQPYSLTVNANGHVGSVGVSKCSKCHVIGDPPRPSYPIKAT